MSDPVLPVPEDEPDARILLTVVVVAQELPSLIVGRRRGRLTCHVTAGDAIPKELVSAIQLTCDTLQEQRAKLSKALFRIVPGGSGS